MVLNRSHIVRLYLIKVMCQLLGMNCNTPTDIVFSFEGFRRRAGLTDCHSDGFGIAFLKDVVYVFFVIIKQPVFPPSQIV